MKRRRMLQYSSSDTEISINDELLSSEFMKSKVIRFFIIEVYLL